MNLLVIGDHSASLVPSLLGAVCAGVGGTIRNLNLFCLNRTERESTLSELTEDLNQCRSAFLNQPDSPVFSTRFSFVSACSPLPDYQTLVQNEKDQLLLSALRGRGIPLSFQADREAVSWVFSAMLASLSPSPAVQKLKTWLSGLQAGEDHPARLTLLFDPSDPFEAGATLALIRFLRFGRTEDSLFLALLAVQDPNRSRLKDSADSGRAFLQAVQDGGLLRRLDGEKTEGADALWLLSLPSSLVSDSDLRQLLVLSAVRILGMLDRPDKLPACGLHIRMLPGSLSWRALEENADAVLAFFQTSVWFASEVFPFLRGRRSAEGARRDSSFKNSLTRQIQKKADQNPAFFQSAESLERVVRLVLAQTVSVIRALPPCLLPSEENLSRWKLAVSACGRAVTTASELDVSLQESKDSGLDRVMPVHRVSMADTEEEAMLRRLDDMENRLEHETAAREEALRAVGGARAVQVLQDCREKCLKAAEAAREQLQRLMNAPETEHLTLLAAERRLRRLDAAILRCDQDLAVHLRADRIVETPSSLSSDLPAAASPVSLNVLDSLEQLLQNPGGSSAEKDLRDQLPRLLPALSFSDEKTTIRRIVKHPEWNGIHDLSGVFRLFFRVFSEDLSEIQWPAGEELPDLPLLPDLYPVHPVVTIPDLLSLFPVPQDKPSLAHSRGLLAFLLLKQYRRTPAEEGRLAVEELSAGQSPLVSAWLSCHRADNVRIVSIVQDSLSLPFVLILPGQALIPAHLSREHSAMVPPYISWFRASANEFEDPGKALSSAERSLLLHLLDPLSDPGDPAVHQELRSFLSDFALSLQENDPGENRQDPHLTVLLKSVCGLLHLPAYHTVLRRRELPYETSIPEDVLCSCLAGHPVPPAVLTPGTADSLYYWKDLPFAREDSRCILAGMNTAEQDYILNTLDQECGVLMDVSDDFRDTLTHYLLLLRERFPDASPEALKELNRLLTKTGKPLGGKKPKLTWPWDPLSPSVRTVMAECLGETLADPALQPFSDLLLCFPARGGEVIGDSLMSRLCVVQAQEPQVTEAEAAAQQKEESTDSAERSDAADSVLPPMDPDFASALCRSPEGRTLIKEGLWSFRRKEDGGIRAVLTLEGSFTLRLIRNYEAGEIRSLYAHDLPTLAVWPNVPFLPEAWHAYFVYCHTAGKSLSVSVMHENGTRSDLEPLVHERSVTQLETCPVCLFFRWENQSAGALFNLLPRPDLPSGGPVTLCADIGSSASSLIISGPGGISPLRGVPQVRVLLNNPARSGDLLRKEFIPADAVSSLFPAVIRFLLPASAKDPVPLQDGVLLSVSGLREALDLPPEALYTCMKWDDLKGRAMKICLHQMMLEAALQARISGASSISWRFAVPDEMAPEGREYLWNLLRQTAETVRAESGFPLPARGPLVSFASESQAVGAYFRFCEPEETRGGLMVLDLGSSTADLSLTLRGRSQADWAVQLPMGIHYLLLPPLLADPDLLLNEFGFVPEEAFRNGLYAFHRILTAARTDPASLRQARLALDTFVGDFGPLLSSVIGSSLLSPAPGLLSARLLFSFSFLMMLAGLMLLQVSSDPMQNDFLPDQMGLFLSGRGSLLVQALPDPIRQGLWRIANMFRNPRVGNLLLLFSSEKKMEIPAGLSALSNLPESLPRPPTVPSAFPVRLEELLPEFLLSFRNAFPPAADLLFRGFFTPDFYHPFSAPGESIVSASIQQIHSQILSGASAPHSYTVLASWPDTLLEMIRESVS